MAIQGKKINELDSISTVTDATVFPAVRVEGSTPSSTATKVSISQLKENLREDIYTKEQVDTLVGQKQDTLTAGANITIEEDSDENLVISAEAGDALPSQTGNSGKFLTTDGTAASWAAVNALQNTATNQSSSLTINGTATSTTLAVNVGPGSQATASGATSVGVNANAASSAIAIGYNAKATATDAICIGVTNVGATKQGSISIGKDARADGQKSVAIGYEAFCNNGTYNIAIGGGAYSTQDYSIQLGKGINNTANTFSVALDSTHNYQLLNSSGKIPNDRLNIDGTTIINDNGTLKAVSSGGGAPSMNWFVNKTGSTLNTGLDLSSASLVKVYKNGSLLTYGVQPTEVQYTTYTGGTDKYLTLSTYPTMTSVSTWSINCRFTWDTTDSGPMPAIFAESQNYDRGCPTLLVDSGQVVVWASSPDNWDFITGFGTGLYPQVGETYDIILGYTGAKYYFRYKLKDSNTYTEVDIGTSNLKVNWQCPLALLNQLRTSSTMANSHNSSSIWIDFFKIYTNGEIFFDGATATVGTNYVNHNCTTGSQTGYVTFDKYSINNQTITFIDPLVSTDEVCVELFL